MTVLKVILSVLLFILKAIGIILLALLALILLVLLSVLFVPVRYKAEGNVNIGEEILENTDGSSDGLSDNFGKGQRASPANVKACISWLFHIILIRVWTEGNTLHYYGKLFGKKIVDSSNPKAKRKKHGKRRSRKGEIKEAEHKGGIKGKDTVSIENEAEMYAHADKNSPQKNGEHVFDSKESTEKSSPKSEGHALDSNSNSNENSNKGIELNLDSEDSLKKQGEHISDKKESSDKDAEQAVKNEAGCNENTEQPSEDTDSSNENQKNDNDKKSFADKIRDIFYGIYDKINKIKFNFINICDKIKNVNGIKEEFMEFLGTEESRSAIGDIKYRIIQILLHIRPTRLKINASYGLTDPSATGQIYGVLCILLARYGDKVNINPQFTDVKKPFVKGSFKCRGRIRAAVLLIHAVKIYKIKRLKEFIAFAKGKGKKNGR